MEKWGEKRYNRAMWQGIKNIYHLFVAFLANIRYGFPTKKLTVIGVTGTDGKTTTVNMIYAVLKKAEKKVSMVSSINAVIAGKAYDTGFHVSSPDPFVVQKFAKEAVRQGDEFLILEVTSHALDQYRFWGISFDIGVITNITHDHLDYHKTWDNYFLTKARLISSVRIAVLNRDEKHFVRLSKLTNRKIVSFGFSKDADFNPKNFPLKLKMPGDYNILNGLAASATCININIEENIIRLALAPFSNLTGRMEEVKNSKGIKIIIDFASTPNALEQALKTLKKQTKGKLIAVFGSAGQRDIEKRALMGEISAKLADITIITAEDPRGDLELINNQIVAGATKMGAKLNFNLFVVEKRDKAIGFAINKIAKKKDTIGFFGKAHEKSMNYDGKKEEPWNEFETVKKALSV